MTTPNRPRVGDAYADAYSKYAALFNAISKAIAGGNRRNVTDLQAPVIPPVVEEEEVTDAG